VQRLGLELLAALLVVLEHHQRLAALDIRATLAVVDDDVVERVLHAMRLARVLLDPGGGNGPGAERMRAAHEQLLRRVAGGLAGDPGDPAGDRLFERAPLPPLRVEPVRCMAYS
jgi:hypothetical protein